MTILPSDFARRSLRTPVKPRVACVARVEFASFELEDFARADLLLRDGHKCLMCFGRKFPLSVYTYLTNLVGVTEPEKYVSTDSFGLLCDRCGRYAQEEESRPGFFKDFQIKVEEAAEEYHSPLTCDCGCRTDAQVTRATQKWDSFIQASTIEYFPGPDGFDASVTVSQPTAPTPLSVFKTTGKEPTK